MSVVLIVKLEKGFQSHRRKLEHREVSGSTLSFMIIIYFMI